ncbi:MAG: hypothetical protein P1P65_07140 [Treponema sp.]
MMKDGYTDWMEALLRLSDRTFFNLMRLYLGEIKTPFNKQRLIERLTGFLSKAEMQEIIVQSLDSLDILMLTAVHILPQPTRNELMRFFSSDFYVQTRLFNMEERLLIYCTGSEINKKKYKINPLLYKAVEPLLDSNLFFLPEKTAEPEQKQPAADDILLAGIYTFFLKDSAALKVNGTFKLKTVKQFQAVFPEVAADMRRLELLCSSLQNLGLLVRSETNLIPQRERWEEFFQQPLIDRKMYIAAAACGHTRRDTLHRRAQFFTDFFAGLDPCGIYRDEMLKRFFYYTLQKELAQSGQEVPLFSDMRNDFEAGIIADLKTLGFFLPKGGLWQLNTAVFSQETIEQPLIAAPSFEITVLPYTSFKRIFPVLNCMEPVSILTTGRFEITRAACARCFEKYGTDQTVTACLNAATAHNLPQNIQMSISEWYIKCTAVGLYHGFVLSVAEEKRNIFQQNAALQGIIYKELAPGVYLIKQIGLESVRTMIKSAGLDLTFYGSAELSRYTAARFMPVEYRPVLRAVSFAGTEERNKERIIQEKKYREYSKTLEDTVDALSVSYEDKRNIKDKIAKKLILTEAQLCTAFTDTETREVSGLDFLGKIHLAETAIAERRFVELFVDEPHGRRIIAGIPVAVDKTEHDAVLLIQIRDSQNYERVSIARTVKMVALRDSLFQ